MRLKSTLVLSKNDLLEAALRSGVKEVFGRFISVSQILSSSAHCRHTSLAFDWQVEYVRKRGCKKCENLQKFVWKGRGKGKESQNVSVVINAKKNKKQEEGKKCGRCKQNRHLKK